MEKHPGSILSWSSGKDSAYALLVCKRRGIDISALFSLIDPRSGRTVAHNTSQRLLRAQAESINLPLYTLHDSPRSGRDSVIATNSLYAMLPVKYGIKRIIFGDIAEEEVRRGREKYFGSLGFETLFPIWGKGETTLRSKQIRKSGIKAIVISVDNSIMDDRFLGMEYDEKFIRMLPNGVDPCGENGEFHTFCYKMPLFRDEIRIKLTKKRRFKGFSYYDAILL